MISYLGNKPHFLSVHQGNKSNGMLGEHNGFFPLFLFFSFDFLPFLLYFLKIKCFNCFFFCQEEKQVNVRMQFNYSRPPLSKNIENHRSNAYLLGLIRNKINTQAKCSKIILAKTCLIYREMYIKHVDITCLIYIYHNINLMSIKAISYSELESVLV